MRPKNNELGPLEAEVMELVWAHKGPITVKQIHTALRGQRPIAYTTVMTAVHLADKGILRRERARHARAVPWQYTPAIHRQALIAERVEQLLASIGVDEVERQYVAAEIRRGRVGV